MFSKLPFLSFLTLMLFSCSTQATILMLIHRTTAVQTTSWRRILIRWESERFTGACSVGWFIQIDLLTELCSDTLRFRWLIHFILAFLVQVKKNQKLWDHKVKQLLKRDEENNDEPDDNQDDNQNDVERTWWSEWVNKKTSPPQPPLFKWTDKLFACSLA